MQGLKNFRMIGFFFFFVLSPLFLWVKDVSAQIQIVWHLASWSTTETVCTLWMPTDATPDNKEILNQCGVAIYEEWLTSPPCENPYAERSKCTGLYLRKIGEYKTEPNPDSSALSAEQEIPFRIQIDLLDCDPMTLCPSRPEIQISLISDRPAELTGKMYVRMGSEEFVCEDKTCLVQLKPTDDQGLWFYYWLISPDGTSAVQERFLYRAVPEQNGSGSYYFDMIHSAFPQFIYPGSDVWFVFPPLGGTSAREYKNPDSVGELYTSRSYDLLCRHLIWTGEVDTDHCIGNGLIDGGPVNLCGEAACAFKMLDVQNQYDELILKAGKQHHISTRLLKGLIAQESQFVPVSNIQNEFGLGKISWLGFDLLLRQNQPYFDNVCSGIFTMQPERCSYGFEHMAEEDQDILLGCLYKKIGTCEEIDMIAATVKASLNQVMNMIANISMFSLSDISDYESLWKFTVANYYVGSGCLLPALRYTYAKGFPLKWEYVQYNFRSDCMRAVEYVEKVYGLAF